MKKNHLLHAMLLCCYSLLTSNLKAQDLENGLIAHFPLNGNGTDVSPTSINGSLVGTSPTNGYQSLASTALHFNTGDNVTCGTDNRGITSEFSISVWLKTTSTSTTHVVSKYNYPEDRGFYIGTYNNKMILAGRNGVNQFIYAGLGITDVNDGNWHHVVATCDGATWNLYVDCNLETTITVNSPNPNLTTTIPLTIGYFYNGDNGDYRYFNGDIDEVRIYNRVLDDSERLELCDTELLLAENTLNEQVVISYLEGNQFEVLWDSDEEYQVIWCDLTGKENGSRVGKGKINLENESSGIYFVQISTKSGELVSQTKIANM